MPMSGAKPRPETANEEGCEMSPKVGESEETRGAPPEEYLRQ